MTPVGFSWEFLFLLRYSLIGTFGSAGVGVVLLAASMARIANPVAAPAGWEAIQVLLGVSCVMLAILLARAFRHVASHLTEFPQDSNALI